MTLEKSKGIYCLADIEKITLSKSSNKKIDTKRAKAKVTKFFFTTKTEILFKISASAKKSNI